MFTILNDSEIAEAVIGGIAFFLAIWYFRSYLNWSRTKSAGFIFPLVWIFRKAGVNIYKYLKSQNINYALKTIKTST